MFDLAPTQENLEDMSHEERQALVKVLIYDTYYGLNRLLWFEPQPDS